MSQTFKVFYYEDDLPTAAEVKTSLEEPPSKPSEPLLEVSHYAKAWHAFKAIEQCSGKPPDVALLNIHEEGYSRAGIDICKRIKEEWQKVPVIMLSGFATVRDQIDGYDAGAAAYLSKSLLEEKDCGQLIKAVVIRHLPETTCPPPPEYFGYTLGSLTVDRHIPRVCWQGKQVRLSPIGIDLVDELASDRDRGGLRTFDRLAEVGGFRAESKEQMRINVIKHMSTIRKAFRKIDEEFGKAGYGIIPVPGRGYRWQSDEPDHC